MSREFLLPDLGSGLKEGEIVQWRVAVGDVVTTDDLLVDIETEKAVIEVPVPYDGTVIALAAEEGEVLVDGQSLWQQSDSERSDIRNSRMGFIYQFHHLLPEFTALENVAMPLLIRGETTSVAAKRATDLLEKVGLSQRMDHKPGELSGGERQRAAVARALVGNPGCVLGDEPTGNLDERTANQVFEQLLELNTELNTSLILVTHDMRLAARLNQRYELHMGSLRPF